jgi:putative tryptophan/tyrosine transport system substrate-binding protein
MRRRDFIAGLCGAAVAWPLAARAQQAAGMPVIGIVHSESMEVSPRYMLSFSKGLAEVGFVEGHNVVIEHRWDEGHPSGATHFLADLMRRQVSVIFVGTTGLARMAKEATRTIPIVFLAGGDPVESGVVVSLNRPGGNVTGVALLATEIVEKRAFQQAGNYVGRILKGDKPTDLQSFSQPSLNWQSTSRPPKRLALPFRRPCSHSPTR